MADGVYEGEVRAEGRDEIALLARTFNQMGRRIKEQIDALKRADALLIAQERLAAVGQLAAGIAHEVRNPLSAIKMNIQILSRKPTTAEADREYWEILIQEVNRLDRLVNDTLDYSQPAGLSRTWCDLRKILEESKEVVHQGGEPIRFVESHAMPLPRIYADERRIKQVLLNLLINACQALEGERRIGLFTDVVRREGREFVRVAIADAGSGILPEDLGRIFDPFFSRKAKGVGLGLAICKRIVEEHGGIIEARSGNGATDGLPEESVWVTVFRIWFPAAGGVGV
ncbi:MAG: ATP-binding protein, partial [Candidatus Methylomirabilota bacterium]